MNGRRISADEAEEEKKRMRDLLGLPICDVIRDGPDELVDAAVKFRDSKVWNTELLT
jgi:uncharacterized NAD-dependent epimerase/dehydratase family protein